MKSYKQFISESINIAGDFTGNLYVNSQPEQHNVGEEYIADVMWNGSLHRMEIISKNGIPSKIELGEQLQSKFPGAVVQQIYPTVENNLNIKNTQRYHPSKLEWI